MASIRTPQNKSTGAVIKTALTGWRFVSEFSEYLRNLVLVIYNCEIIILQGCMVMQLIKQYVILSLQFISFITESIWGFKESLDSSQRPKYFNSECINRILVY